MASLLELFALLDGWDESRLGVPVVLSPDPALAAARRAIQDGAGADAALAAILAQIDIARPALRGVLLDVVDTQASPEKLRNILCDLHVSAARLLIQKRQFDRARSHLVRAAACASGKRSPAMTLESLYESRGTTKLESVAESMRHDPPPL